jgi:hypothetical protein
VRSLLAVLFCVLIANLSAGCGGTAGGGQVASVSVTDSFSSVQAGGGPIKLTAVVTPTGSGVNWSLSFANNIACSPACGTLVVDGFLTATYEPPKVEPTNQNATITVTSQADSKQTYSFDFSIGAPIGVTITNKFTAQYAGAPGVTVNATVSNDSSNAGVAWTLTAGGNSCSPTCGTLTVPASPTFSATYTPPATVPMGADASPTITATSVVSTSAQDSFSFTISSPLSLLSKGSYAFLLRGYDGGGLPMAMAGSVTSDGQGNITAGNIDINDDGGITSVPSPVTGNYTIDLSFNSVTHGTITITSFTFPNSTDNIVLKFVLSADGSRGRMVELDGSGYLNAGTIQLQDSSALSAANPAGTYAFLLDSDAPVGGRTVEVGQLVLASGGSVTSGLVDQSKAGNIAPTYTATAATGGASTAPNSSGRGTFTVTVSGNASQYAYYIVNSQQLNLIQIDPAVMFGTTQAGTARIQSTLTADSVNTNSVAILQLTGMDAVPNSNNVGPDVLVGAMTISAGTNFNLTFDENDIGTIFSAHPTGGSVASFDPTTGRGTLSLTGGFNSGFVNSAVFYLYDDGEGFLIDTDPTTIVAPPQLATTNVAFSGIFTTQAAGPFSASSLSGNVIAMFGASAIPAIPNLAAAFNFDGVSAFTAAGDMTTVSSQQGNLPGISFSGTYSIADTALGRGTAMVPAYLFGYFGSNQQYPASFYIIGPNQFALIGAQTGAYSGLAFFDPQ